jgi:4-hydroxy-2-oxoheptanedioate aldolase
MAGTGARGDALRASLRAPGASIGLWAALPSAFTAGLAAAAGPDYVVVDEQHGAVGPVELLAMLDAIGAAGRPPLVRVGRNDPWVIGRALDLGAHGVIVPLVESAEQAAAAVAACRYAPGGVRSFGALRGGPDPAPVCLVMIETGARARRARRDRAHARARRDLRRPVRPRAEPRAPADDRDRAPAVVDAIAAIRAACRREDRIAGVHCLTAQDAARWAGEDLDLVTAGADLSHLGAALAAVLATARGA